MFVISMFFFLSAQIAHEHRDCTIYKEDIKSEPTMILMRNFTLSGTN